MTRSMALRAFVFFVIVTAFFGSVGLGAYVPVAEVIFLISASLCAVMLAYACVTPAPSALPVRIRARRR